MKSIRLTVKGKTRIIREIKANTDESFRGVYQGCEITISEMGERDPKARKRWSFEVRGRDGCLMVDTWEYADEKDRTALLTEALENILFVHEK